VLDCITWVGLDTSKKKHVAAILMPGGGEPQRCSVANEERDIARFARRLVREAQGGEVRVCYEAGPCGFALMRQLERAAPLVCEVVAPALTPIRPGDRVKTDRRDAQKLARLYRAGELTTVHAPTESQEAARDLVRCREDVQEDLLRARHRLSKFLLRRGRVYRGRRSWTDVHGSWLDSLGWDQQTDCQVFADYRLAIAQLLERLRSLETEIDVLAEQKPYREPVGWLRCFRGIQTVSAMTILVEIHDFTRFTNPRQLMSYLGMVPSEYSSGEQRHQGGLTKAGNAHVRRILVQCAWNCRQPPRIGPSLRRRRVGQPGWVLAHADRAMQRLHRRYRRLAVRGKERNKVVVAVARELIGFLWAVMREGEMHRAGKGGQKVLVTEAVA
jgi:transposase